MKNSGFEREILLFHRPRNLTNAVHNAFKTLYTMALCTHQTNSIPNRKHL